MENSAGGETQRPYAPPSSYPPAYVPPQNLPSASLGSMQTGFQNLSMGSRPTYPPPPPGALQQTAAARPYPTSNVPSSAAGSLPNTVVPQQARQSYMSGPPNNRPTAPPFGAAFSTGVTPATNGPPGPPPAAAIGTPRSGPFYTGTPPLSTEGSIAGSAVPPFAAASPLTAHGSTSRPPFSAAAPLSNQGSVSGSMVPAAPSFATAMHGNTPARIGPTTATSSPSWSQSYASNGPLYQDTPALPGGLIRPPVQTQGVSGPAISQAVGGAATYQQRPSGQYPWRPPQHSQLPSTVQGGYGSGSLTSATAPPSTLQGPPSWPMASNAPPPPFSGAPPMQKPQSLPGMPTQTTPPMPPPPMAQYIGQGLSQPGSPAATQSPSRIDPNQIPRPQISSALVEHETRLNNQAASPPSATSNFLVRDTGNCSPRFMRCTLNQIPCSGDLLSTSGMPLALVVQPFALPHPAEDTIQIVDYGENGIVRCSRCKAYINAFMKFIEQGRRFRCNFCGHTNDTPRDYYCNLGPDNRRRDVDERPELCRGTVEFVATKEYMVRPPMSPLFFFLIDVSMGAVSTGMTVAACSAVQRVLADLPDDPRTKVGIATFDSTIHFYNFHRALQQPSMLVVPDIQDVYAPLQTGLFVSVSEYREQLEQLLENIPSMFQGATNPDSAVCAAIKGAFLAIKSYGGKLMVFQSGLPSTGFGALTARDADFKKGPPAGEKDPNKLLQPADKTLKTIALELAEFQVCCDLFVMAQEYVDVASLAVVPGTTGGQIYYYYPFSATSDSAKLFNDLRWNVTRPQGLEAVMRVRCSQGLQVQDYYGNFCKLTPTDVDLPAIDCDKSIMVTFKHDDKLQDGSECCFQCALLYTTMHGQRRIRITTLSLPCTSVLSNVFRGADLDAQFTYFMKQAAQQVPTGSVAQVRDQMTSSCVNVLYAYRKFCATASSSGQLILPEALKLLPLYTLALTKSFGLRSDMRTDDRSYWLAHVASISTSLAIPTVYPRMFAIHDIASKEVGDGTLPSTLYLSSENLDNEGIFLLETGEDAYIYAGKSVSSELLFQLFGVRSVNEIPPNQFILQEFDNEASRKLNALVNEIRKQRCSFLRFRWCRRGDPLEFVFFSLMVEDKNTLGSSYVEYLVHIHRQIQNKMA